MDSTPLSPPARRALQLATPFYLQGLARDQERARRRARSLPAFVISIGNLVVGGTGKTPFTLWLADHLASQGFRVAVVSRGYGGSVGKAAQVPLTGETSTLVRRYGDEPVLLARKLSSIPVWVGQERYEAGLAAIRSSRAEVLILDDGFQHLALHRDLDLVLLDSRNPFGNGEILPLGPLREPVSHLQRASAFVLTRADEPERSAATRRLIRERFPGKPVFACTHQITDPAPGMGTPRIAFQKLAHDPAGAFAGIAHPESFFEALRREGALLRREWAFPDHHVYSRGDLMNILEGVRRDGLRWLVTTEKDYVRLPSWFQSMTLPVGIELDFGSDLKFLHGSIGSALESIADRRDAEYTD
ncbi:MAG: tetraacyldisaccharide 4'-kinase [Syntrophobacteraceae bacterium]|jgi:tetraacyldisaccharide 4'-kinase|nr:tetraacyldisaccharide 4'-kinase [Syntrophobacteraceae bacterium]